MYMMDGLVENADGEVIEAVRSPRVTGKTKLETFSVRCDSVAQVLAVTEMLVTKM